MPVTDLRYPQRVDHDNEASVRRETHPILIKSVSLYVYCISKCVHCNQVAPEASPVGHDKEYKEAPLELLYECISNHRVVLTQLVFEQAFIFRVPFLTQL